MTRVERILIVGAGMAGLSLAIALRRQGIDPEIVERQAAWPHQGAGIYLVGNAVRALRSLDLADQVLAQGSVIRSQTILNHRGRKLVEIDVETIWANCGPCVAIHRARLQQILVDGLGDGKVRFSTTVAAARQHDQGVAVEFDDGSETDYDLVVGADAVHSSMRSLLFDGSQARYCGQVAWRFLAQCPKAISGWTLFYGRRGVFLIIPVASGQAYCYADAALAEPIDDPLKGRLDRLRSRFADFASPVPELLAQLKSPDEIHFGAIEGILQNPWSVGSVVLIGDAAHATSPNMASGAAMAFEDSLVLAELIVSARDAPNVIAEYTKTRIARIRWVHEQTRRRDRLRNLPPVLRDLVTRFFAERLYRANYQPLMESLQSRDP